MDIEHYLTTRPFAYHTTAAANLAHLRVTRAIESTARLFARAGREGDPLLRQRRGKSVPVQVAGVEIIIRDQLPLAEGAIALEGGWTFDDLVSHLNGLVFPWPGDHRGPSGKYGSNHFARYEASGEALAVLRIPSRALLEANPTRPPRCSRCNSGAPRCNPAFQATKGKVPGALRPSGRPANSKRRRPRSPSSCSRTKWSFRERRSAERPSRDRGHPSSREWAP